MWHHSSKLDRANVVAAFNSQDDSDEAVLGLRMAGFRDYRIGYYCAAGKGQMMDRLAHYHRFAASVIGTIIGVGAGLLLARWSYPAMHNLDPVGLMQASTVCGALFLGTAGGLMGMWSARTGPTAPIPQEVPESFMLAVDAGNERNEAWTIIHQHGGHEVRTEKSALPALAD
ncbi:MAG TPA: hypothetical protein VG122_00760 [Gemmata sp.]|jgi:hypothetical protein|nr:hypothetical protein [Gemmata sp.]